MLAKTEQRINRENLIRELRSGKHKQKRGTIGEWQQLDQPVCFVGLHYRTLNREANLTHTLGISPRDADHLVCSNDSGYSFSDLATMLEEMDYYTKPTTIDRLLFAAGFH